MGEHMLSPFPLVIIGVLGMLEGLSVLVLPEILGHKLLKTVVDAEILGRNKHKIQNKLNEHWDFTVLVL
jgi:hypothetical protein